jgi:protein-disulfide isomerase
MTQRTHLAVPVSGRDHTQGPATAAVTLIQYGDYECPYTRLSTTIVRAIQQQLGEQLRFVFRNFPLTEIHTHALHAALAAEAAAAQGKFWQMHDYIFHHQHTLEDSDLAHFAEAVGLNLQQYAQALTDQHALARIEEDVAGGERSGVQGAPPRSSSMASCIAVPGSVRPCFLHSRQRAELREALEVRSQ